MEVEDIIASEEDMDAEEGGAASSAQIGGTESPDKKCKLDPATIGKMDML